MLTRLETGRIVVLSLLLGMLVGGLGIVLRVVLDVVLPWGAWLTGFSPPGPPGEGGLLMAFGDALPWGLLFLPFIGGLYAWLVPAEPGAPYSQLVRGYHARGQWPDVWTGFRTLLATVIAHASGLLIGRDSAFVMVGQIGTRLLGRATRLDAVESRTLMLAGAAAGLGTALHAPLAAAVLIVEILYRRFEFEFEVLMPCVLAAVAAYAIYGLGFGFSPLLSVVGAQLPAAGQVPLYLLLALIVTLLGWILLFAARVVPSAWTDGWLRPVLGGLFGLLTASMALLSAPGVLGDGLGWLQLGLNGFLSEKVMEVAVWRWLLLALGARLAFGGGLFPSVATGGLLGVGLGMGLGLDPAVSGLIGATAFLTVTLNVPVGAALLAVAWGGDTLLPVVLVAAGMAHFLSGETGIVPGQVRSRAVSGAHATPTFAPLPDTVRFMAPRSPAQPAAPIPFDAPADGQAHEGAAAAPERELYRRAVPGGWQGTKLHLVSLPPGVEIVGIVRDGTVRVPRPEMRLTADDELVFLARPQAYAALEGLLRLPGA